MKCSICKKDKPYGIQRGKLTCDKSTHVRSNRCFKDIFQMEDPPYFWGGITFTLLNKIRCFKSLSQCPKMNYKIFFHSFPIEC